jgi:hypothetical protein
MVILNKYNEFAGRHTETGTVRNALAYQGVTAPHTGQPCSEALLLGISGGITFGYFTFEYTGYPPHISLLTRNTFDPLETIFERLAIPRDVIQTTSPEKAEVNLRETLEGGRPAIVWADMFSLTYNDLPYDEHNWGVVPLLVYGLEEGQAYLADRAAVPIIVPAAELENARARIKKNKFRVMTLDAPDMSQLASAVSKGIWQCISLYTDAPPKGKRDNFGLSALKHWADMLTNQRNKQSWARYFPPGDRLWMALAGNRVQPGIFSWIRRDPGNSADRGRYADFLKEAAIILDKPGLIDAAALFVRSEAEWTALTELILPPSIPVFKETSELLARRHDLFIGQGAGALEDIRQIHARLQTIQQTVASAFPLSDSEVTAYFKRVAEQVLVIHAVEQDAVARLQSAMA